MMKSDFGKLLLFALILSFACSNHVLSAQQWPPAPEVTDRIEAARDMLNELVKAMPADLSDPETLADTLDYEMEVAHQFVRDRVRFEPYLGVLKGPQGTAMTLAGNAWDQALLLSNLINIMGGEAQVVTGRLDSTDAELLLNRAFVASKRGEEVADTSVLIPILARYDPELANSIKQTFEQQASGNGSDDLRTDTRRLAGLLLEMVDMTVEPGGNTDSLKQLTDKLASSYAWVRWRDGPSDEWQALHPVFAEGQLPSTTETGVIVGSIPGELQHRLSISLLIERQLSGDKIEREPIMDTYSRPTAQLFKHDLTIGFGPMPGPPGSAVDAAFILPFVNGSVAPGGKAVNAIGLTADASAALQPGAGDLFARLSSRMGSAIGALGGVGDETETAASGPRLTGTVMQFKLHGPGFETPLVERRLVDYRGEVRGEFPQAFAFSSVVKVNIGGDTGTRVARQFIEQQSNVIAAIPSLFGVSRGALSYEQAITLPEFRSLPGPSWLDADTMSGALMPTGSNNVALSRPSAFVMARYTRTQATGKLLTYSDVIFNPSLVLRRDAGSVIRIDPESILEQGVRETLIESALMLEKSGWSERKPVSVITTMDELASHKLKAGWSPAAGELAARDIENGFKLVVTNVAEHWWRVDAESGSTLGMGALGGQEVGETPILMLIGGAVISSLFFYLSVESCDDTYPDNREMADCCIVGNLAITYGGSLVGAVGASPGAKVAELLTANRWSSASGKLIASVVFGVGENVVVGQVTSGPLDSACRDHLANQ